MDKELCRIRDVARAVAHFEQNLQTEFGLNLNEAMLLCSLFEQEIRSSGEIGQLLGLTSSNASKVICSVEKKGFIKRSYGRNDKRQMYFSLTTKGSEKIEQLRSSDIFIPDVEIRSF